MSVSGTFEGGSNVIMWAMHGDGTREREVCYPRVWPGACVHSGPEPCHGRSVLAHLSYLAPHSPTFLPTNLCRFKHYISIAFSMCLAIASVGYPSHC